MLRTAPPRRGRVSLRRLRRVAPAALLALACAFGASPPDWIDETPAPYRDERWVVGVGSGMSARQAERDALEQIAQQTGGATVGAEIVDTWTHPDQGIHWAFAVLDRVPLRERTEADLFRIEQEIAAARARARSGPPDQGLREILRAMELASERELLQLRVARLGGPDPPIDDPLARELQEDLELIKQKLTIEIAAFEVDPVTGEIGEPVDELRRALAQRVTEMGFPVSQRRWGWQEDPTWILIECRLGLDALDLPDRDRLTAVHWDAAVEITDGAGKLIAVRTEEGRATHVSEREARRQAREAAETFAGDAIEDWLAGEITPEVTASR